MNNKLNYIKQDLYNIICGFKGILDLYKEEGEPLFKPFQKLKNSSLLKKQKKTTTICLSTTHKQYTQLILTSIKLIKFQKQNNTLMNCIL
jgi:hypothetical protein